MRKTSVIITVLMVFMLYPAMAQQDERMRMADAEIVERTNFQPISEQRFKFPSSNEAIEVFKQGKKLLDIMEKESMAAPPQPYLETEFTEHGLSEYFSYYCRTLQPALIKEADKQKLQHYQDFYKQIVWKKDGSPDLTKAATAKAYLAFYNLIHRGTMSKLQVGRIDEHFPFLGVYADSFVELDKKFRNNNAYVWLLHELYYTPNKLEMIPQKDVKQAKDIAKEMLYRDLQNHGLTQDQINQWFTFATSWQHYQEYFPTQNGNILPIVSRGNWYLTIFVSPNVEDEDPYRIAIHEFQHVKDFFPGFTGTEFYLKELTSSIKDVVTFDAIYRQIHNIPDTEVVKYKYDNDILKVKLGEIAVFFRNLSQEYQTDNYAQLLLNPKATKYIENVYDNFLEKNVLKTLKESNIDPALVSREKIEQIKELSGLTIQEMLRKDIEIMNSQK